MGTTLIPPFHAPGAQRYQAIAALGEANRVRLRRASLTRWMYGQTSAQSHENAAELILEPDPAVGSMLDTRAAQPRTARWAGAGRADARVR